MRIQTTRPRTGRGRENSLPASCLCPFGPLSQKYHAPGGRNNGHSFLKVLGAGSLRSRCRQAGCRVGALALVGGRPISSCVLTWCRGRGGSPGSLIRVLVPFARAAPSQLVTSQRPRLLTPGLRLQCDEGGGPHALVSKSRPFRQADRPPPADPLPGDCVPQRPSLWWGSRHYPFTPKGPRSCLSASCTIQAASPRPWRRRSSRGWPSRPLAGPSPLLGWPLATRLLCAQLSS